MQRRAALKNLALAAGLLQGLPAWANAWNGQTLRDSTRWLSAGQENTLADVLETLLPKTDTPGAKDLGLPAFVQTMLKDCYEAPARENVAKTLTDLDALAGQTYQQSFSALDAVRREDLLKRLELSPDASQKEAYGLLRNLAILGFTTSEYVLVNHLRYNPMPGHYHGCVPVPVG